MSKLAEFFKTHNWCQGVSARDAEGYYANPQSKDAVSWCLLGAASKVYGDKALKDVNCDIYRRLTNVTGFVLMSAWNDTRGRTKEEVIKVCEEAGV